MDSILGSVFGPQNGGRFVGKIVVTERKKAQVSIVSHVRNKSFPYRWVSMVLQRREYLFPTPEFTLQESPSPSELPPQPTARELALGCLSSTGIATLTLTQGFKVIGAHACDNCHLLKNVDLSNTQIEEIQEFTFVHCTSLKEVRLPRHSIRFELRPS